MRSKLSVLGMFNYDSSILDELVVPGTISKSDLVNNILIETSDMEVLYPEPSTLRMAVGIWSRSMLPSWERQLRAINEDYNPIHNYDRREEWTDDGNSTGTGHSEGQSDNKVAGFDTGTLTQKDRTTTSADSNDHRNDHNTHMGHLYGNIGVTTSSELVKGELELRADLSMINIITQDFRKHFCLLVY